MEGKHLSYPPKLYRCTTIAIATHITSFEYGRSNALT